MNDHSVGAQLKQARLARALSLKQVTQTTKIQPWVLEALESDTLQSTMSPVYLKGFVTSYARFLGLDPAALAAQLLPAPAEVVSKTAAEASSAVPSWPSVWPIHVEIPWLLLQRLGTVGIGAAVLVVLIKVHPLRWFAATSTPRQEASFAIARDPLRPHRQDVVIPLKQSLELKVVARRPTWISVQGDGRLLAQQELIAGSQESWKAKHAFEVIVAKPFHVDILLNGQSISPLLLAHQGRLLITRRAISALPTPPTATAQAPTDAAE